MRLTTEFDPTGRTAGRYWGNAAEGEVPGGEPAGRDEAGDADPAGRDAAGVADGFVFTSTSAAKRAGPASKATTIDNQNLGMGSYATHCGRFRKINLLSEAVSTLH